MENKHIKLLFLFLISLTIQTYMLNAQTQIVAHRGFSSKAPENTLTAFQKAIDCGAQYLELDLHKTKDNVVVTIHDKTIGRTLSNRIVDNVDLGSKKVAKMTYKELSKLNFGYEEKFPDEAFEEKLPTLKEVLQMTKGKIKVCIEIKEKDIEAAVLDIVNEVGIEDEVIIFAFDFKVLKKIRKLDQNIPILYLKNKVEFKNEKDKLNISIKKMKKHNVQAIGVGYKTKATKKMINYLHKNDLELWKWTVDDVDEMKSLFDIGLDGLITNCPDKAFEILEQ